MKTSLKLINLYRMHQKISSVEYVAMNSKLTKYLKIFFLSIYLHFEQIENESDNETYEKEIHLGQNN